MVISHRRNTGFNRSGVPNSIHMALSNGTGSEPVKENAMRLSDKHEYKRVYIVAGEEFTSRAAADLRATQLMGKHGPMFVDTVVTLDGEVILRTDNSIKTGGSHGMESH